MSVSRDEVLHEVALRFDSGAFEERLSRLVSVKSTSQDPLLAPDVAQYLALEITPWLEDLGFSVEVHPNPVAGAGPILMAERIESEALPSVVTYGHGDTVLGMEDRWTRGSGPWLLQRDGDRWYGRGTADNKGQHAINLFALEAVLSARSGKLGFNAKLVLETSEEIGSKGLRRFVEMHADRLRGNVFIASDGPRVAPATPTVAAGSRGSYRFDLVVAPRVASVHSGHWGGLTTDPAVVLANALSTICDKRGKVLVRPWLPNAGENLAAPLQELLRSCPVDGGADAAVVENDWGEPGLSAAERLYAWNAFVVLALDCGNPVVPENAVSPRARAICQIRHVPGTDPETFVPALRQHLDRHGFEEVAIDAARVGMPASAIATDSPWISFVTASLETSLGRKVQIIPCTSGGMPGDVFAEVLGLPLVWVPHGHNSCGQHGPDEHLLVSVAREGVLGLAGLWWDLGEGRLPL